MRTNPRTVRTVAHFREKWARSAFKPKWYTDSRKPLLSLFRSLRKWARPNKPHMDPRVRLPRSAMRQFTGSCATREDRTMPRQRAQIQSRAQMEEMRGAQMVLWMDNHYLERYGTTPGAVSLSQNVTAMAVFVADRHAGPRRTRSVHWPGFPGHLEVTALIEAIPKVVDDLAQALPAFIRRVRGTAALDLR